MLAVLVVAIALVSAATSRPDDADPHCRDRRLRHDGILRERLLSDATTLLDSYNTLENKENI